MNNILPQIQPSMQITVTASHADACLSCLENTIDDLLERCRTAERELRESRLHVAGYEALLNQERQHNERLQALFNALTAKEREQTEMLCAVWQALGNEAFNRILDRVPTLSEMAGVVAELRAGA